MTVNDLITNLNNFDPDLEILFYCEDLESFKKQESSMRLFEYSSIQKVSAEKVRISNTPYLKLSNDEYSEEMCIIELTSDF